MITCFAHGFIPDKPTVELIGANKAKCEFTVVSQRSVRRGENWETVWERAIFVAWDEEAERVASRLDKGTNVTCTGNQETSHWTDASGAKRYITKYRLTSWVVEKHGSGKSSGEDRSLSGGAARNADRHAGAAQAQRGQSARRTDSVALSDGDMGPEVDHRSVDPQLKRQGGPSPSGDDDFIMM